MQAQIQYVTSFMDYTNTEMHEGRLFELMSEANSTSLVESGLISSTQLKKLTEEEFANLQRYICFITVDIGYRMNIEAGVRSESNRKGRPNRFEDPASHCSILDLGPGLHALLIRPDTAQASESMLALPVALSNPSCALMRRLWCLQRQDSDDNEIWSVAALHYLFTYHVIEESGDLLQQRRKSLHIKIG